VLPPFEDALSGNCGIEWDIIYRVNGVYHRKMEVLMGKP
jgi:hypothetical protein